MADSDLLSLQKTHANTDRHPSKGGDAPGSDFATLTSIAARAGGLSNRQMGALQRSIGNQATQRIMQPSAAQPAQMNRGTSAGTIQRWPTNTPNLDWDQTKSVSPLMSGQAVLFVKDDSDPPVVVKAEDADFGITLLNSFVHKTIHGTPTVRTTDGAGAKQKLIDLIEGGVGPADKWAQLGSQKDGDSWIVPRTEYDETTGKPNPTRGDTPEQKARHFIADQFRSKPKVQVMKLATGESTRKLAHEDHLAQPDSMSAYRAAFADPEYVRKLGELAAADYFLENDDRVTGNFGNFMTNSQNGILLIDNMNDAAQKLWKSTDVVGATRCLDKLAPSKSAALTKEFMFSLTNEVRNGIKGGDTAIKAWLQEAADGGTRETAIKAQFIEGVNRGRARIIRLYATNKSGKEGRQAKKASKQAYKIDQKSGDASGGVSYWERLKARARYLQKLS